MGISGYYRKFIPSYAEKKNQTRCVGQSMEKEFNNLKVALAGDLVLHCPDYDLPFKLETDASGRGVGAVLSQHFGDGDHPIAYF